MTEMVSVGSFKNMNGTRRWLCSFGRFGSVWISVGLAPEPRSKDEATTGLAPGWLRRKHWHRALLWAAIQPPREGFVLRYNVPFFGEVSQERTPWASKATMPDGFFARLPSCFPPKLSQCPERSGRSESPGRAAWLQAGHAVLIVLQVPKPRPQLFDLPSREQCEQWTEKDRNGLLHSPLVE